MIGGKDVLNRYRKQGTGLPWFVFLDGDGKAIITSDDPDRGNNIGYPTGEESERHFRRMLEAVGKHITPAEIEALIKSMREFRSARLPA